MKCLHNFIIDFKVLLSTGIVEILYFLKIFENLVIGKMDSGASPGAKGWKVGEMVARNDLIVLNRDRDFTFRRVAGVWIIDLTISATRLASRR